MCTAMSLTAQQHYFGRTLDLDYRHEEKVIIMPRRYPMPFCRAGTLYRHFSMIGTAHAPDGVPLYYDATNEHGLSMAGLRFVGCAHYPQERDGFDNIAPFELIPWVLGQCRTVDEAKQLLQRVNLAAIPYSDTLPLTPMHWQIDDRRESLAVEPTADGLMLRENHTRVLTNSPTLPAQLAALARCEAVGMEQALPGGYDSTSRFVRAGSVRAACPCDGDDSVAVPHFFRLMQSVAVPRGMARTADGRQHYTQYVSCCNVDTGTYYYTTYDDPVPRAMTLAHAELDGDALVCCPMISKWEAVYQN